VAENILIHYSVDH